jgi:hypothetical protein
MYNKMIINKIQSDEALALRFHDAIKGTAENITLQINQLEKGLTRLTWYTSCITENYQDVCSKLKEEDLRFLAGVKELLIRNDIILDMIKIYVDERLRGLGERDIKKLIQTLSKGGSRFSTNQATTLALSLSISRSIAWSFKIHNPLIGKTSTISILALSAYGIVQEAADAANRLKNSANFYYQLLYRQRLEMMYFLIEPAFKRISYPWFGDVDGAIYDLGKLLEN